MEQEMFVGIPPLQLRNELSCKAKEHVIRERLKATKIVVVDSKGEFKSIKNYLPKNVRFVDSMDKANKKIGCVKDNGIKKET
ncbi:hypothetical protein [Enterococcus termitis]|uniref:Uncharacterized protein n=1 Tax=Enterococcus termitis TaxID=332950 RepID=A0A1E5GVT8_9ENTE|nr:hypothetical protein [Enterococcus termitis]OEG16801.1 hypothetical protein BCR25_04180 [Enterococcus termitis]OJG99512.1 hypothetical protein RV18_GL001580 [Enterococcus termitis]